jgi:hypothetical protein
MLQRSHGRLQLQAVVKRLKCSRCKQPPARVAVVDYVIDDVPPNVSSRDHAVMVIAESALVPACSM